MGDMIYLVTTGEYSAYRVVKACATKALAVGYAAHCNQDYSGAQVEERKLLTELPALEVKLTCEVVMLADGTVHSPKETETSYWQGEENPPAVHVEIHRRYWSKPDSLEISVRGTDHDRVRKVMSEVLAQAKANVVLWISEGEPGRDALWGAQQAMNKELDDGEG